ncbi:MAG TPA: hypothetical protein VFZ78_08260 [Flavisolibacter sp.]
MQHLQNDPPKDPRKNNERRGEMADSTPRREGGDDALAESSPTDIHSDEKVIVNEQRENKVVNTPSQTDANPPEGDNYDKEL